MELNEIIKTLANCNISGEKLIVESEIHKIIEIIKSQYGFEILKEIIAVDKQENGVELNYRLYSPEDDENVIVATTVKEEAESISDIFDSAVADEKEIYDLFGIKFIGNKELKRLYMPESFEGHPLKKDYEMKDERLSWND